MTRRGQASIEMALAMPVLLVIVLGMLQIFLAEQARLLAQYSVFRAVRAGSMNHGDCTPMLHTAIAALAPSYVALTHGSLSGSGSDSPATRLGYVFRQHANNRYSPAIVPGYSGPIVWMYREHPLASEIPGREDSDWDQATGPIRRLEVQMVYWLPLRIPFANWVLAHIAMANWGIADYSAKSPYSPNAAAWSVNSSSQPFRGQDFESAIKAELMKRSRLKQYVFPIQVSSTMRMMTPPRRSSFLVPTCGYP